MIECLRRDLEEERQKAAELKKIKKEKEELAKASSHGLHFLRWCHVTSNRVFLIIRAVWTDEQSPA